MTFRHWQSALVVGGTALVLGLLLAAGDPRDGLAVVVMAVILGLVALVRPE